MEGSLAQLTDSELEAELAARKTAAGTPDAVAPVETAAPTEATDTTDKSPLEQAQDALAVAAEQLADAVTLLGQVGK